MPNRAALHSALCALLLGVAPVPGAAFGPDGHRIASRLAEPLLCERVAPEIASLVGNRPFEDLGLWADTIRDDPIWAHSAPWHYVNIDDGESLRDFEHPPEGDVVWAIENFSRVLADQSQPAAARAAALQFLVHFIVDVHQPLHVGRAGDRGGNTIEVTYGRTSSNLHAFWDTDAIRRRDLPPDRQARRLEALRDSLPRDERDRDPVAWAEESLALRPQVYSFDQRSGVLDDEYVAMAATMTDERLARAAVRLAETLNGIFCPSGSATLPR